MMVVVSIILCNIFEMFNGMNIPPGDLRNRVNITCNVFLLFFKVEVIEKEEKEKGI